MLRAALLVLAGAMVVAVALAVEGRRAPVLGASSLVAGALVAFGAAVLVDCNQCHTASFAVGGFASLPFFLVGIVSLLAGRLAGPPQTGDRRWSSLALLFLLLQLAWAVPVAWATLVHGRCPCEGLPWGTGSGRSLAAIGVDRWFSLLFVIEAALGLTVLRGGRSGPTRSSP